MPSLTALSFPALCPQGCGKDSPEGHHFFHGYDYCTWHDGPCDEPGWCPCNRSNHDNLDT